MQTVAMFGAILKKNLCIWFRIYMEHWRVARTLFHILDTYQETWWGCCSSLPVLESVLRLRDWHVVFPVTLDFLNILNVFIIRALRGSDQDMLSDQASYCFSRSFLLYTSCARLRWTHRGGGGGKRRPGRDMQTPFFCLLYCGKALVFMDQMFEYFLYDVLDLIKRILVLKEWVIEQSGELWHL